MNGLANAGPDRYHHFWPTQSLDGNRDALRLAAAASFKGAAKSPGWRRSRVARPIRFVTDPARGSTTHLFSTGPFDSDRLPIPWTGRPARRRECARARPRHCEPTLQSRPHTFTVLRHDCPPLRGGQSWNIAVDWTLLLLRPGRPYSATDRLQPSWDPSEPGP